MRQVNSGSVNKQCDLSEPLPGSPVPAVIRSFSGLTLVIRILTGIHVHCIDGSKYGIDNSFNMSVVTAMSANIAMVYVSILGIWNYAGFYMTT